MDEIEQSDVDTQIDEPLQEEIEEDTPEPETPKKEFTTEQKLARVERLRGKYLKELGLDKEPAKVESVPQKSVAGELDEATLDFLDVKGVSEDDEIQIIQDGMKKTGQTARQVLKDDYYLDKLTKLKASKAVKDATPSSTRRSGTTIVDNVDYWFAKYEQSEELPKNMPKGMAEKLVNKKMSQSDSRSNPYE